MTITSYKYKWILFDADGTLFDYEKAERYAFQKTLNEFEIPFNDSLLNEYKTINSELWKQLEKGNISPTELRIKRFSKFADQSKLVFSPEAADKYYIKHLSESRFLIDGAMELLECIKDFVHCAIVTNGLKDVQRSRFINSPIAKYMDEIIISEEIGFAKPSVEYFDYTFDKIGNPNKKDVLIVGDSLSSDIRGGINYGIDTCWYNPSKAGNSNNLKIIFEIEKLEQIIQIIKHF